MVGIERVRSSDGNIKYFYFLVKIKSFMGKIISFKDDKYCWINNLVVL